MRYKWSQCAICGSDELLETEICTYCRDRLTEVFDLQDPYMDDEAARRLEEIAEEAAEIIADYNGCLPSYSITIEAEVDDSGLSRKESGNLTKHIEEDLRRSFFIGMLFGAQSRGGHHDKQ